MRFGGALPSNVLRLEYDHYIYDDFDNLGAGIYRSDVMLMKKNLAKSNVNLRLRRYWEIGEDDIVTVANMGLKIPRYSSGSYIETISEITEGWWKFNLLVDGATCSPPFDLKLIHKESNNWIGIQIGTNNSVILKKRVGGAYTTLIDTNTNLSGGHWHTIEITRDINGLYQAWIDSAFKGSELDVWLPDIESIKLSNNSNTDIYIKELIVNEYRIT